MRIREDVRRSCGHQKKKVGYSRAEYGIMVWKCSSWRPKRFEDCSKVSEQDMVIEEGSAEGWQEG